MVTCYMFRHNKNDDYYHKGKEGGGQRVTIEIIIRENDDNDGWLNLLILFPLCPFSIKHLRVYQRDSRVKI